MRLSGIYAALLFLILLPSCGYRMSGAGSVVPEGYRSLAVATFLNGTSEPYVDTELTRALTDEFLNDGRFRVTGPEEADMVVRGTITSFQLTPLSYTEDAYVKQYRIFIAADVSLEDRHDGKVLWNEQGVSSNLISSYEVAYESGAIVSQVIIEQTKTARERAIKKASKDLAQTIRGRVLEGF